MVKLVLALILLSVLWVLAYRFINPPITATMLGDVVAGRGATRDWMSLEQMDRDMVRAAIGAEDSKFCAHNGFDVDAIQDAVKRNAIGRADPRRIDDQPADRQERLPVAGRRLCRARAAEAWFTFLIEQMWGKRRIMEVYLNVAETGIGTYGANAGSQRYFGHDASAMSGDRGGADRGDPALAQEARRGRAQGLHAALWQYASRARIGVVGRDGLDACVYAGHDRAGEQGAAACRRKPTVDPGRRI